MKKLTDKQEQFCQEYLIDLSIKGASKRSNLHYSYGRRLVAKSHIIRRIDELKNERCERTKIDVDYVLHRFHELESFDFLDIMNDVAKVKPLADWPEAARRTVVGVKVQDLYEGKGKDRVLMGTVTEIKIENRTKSLESLGKHVGFYPGSKIGVGLDEGLLTILDAANNSPLGSPQARIAGRVKRGNKP